MLDFKDDNQHSTPLKKRYYIEDNDDHSLSQPPNPNNPVESHTQSSITFQNPSGEPSSSDDLHTLSNMPDVRDVSDYMNIPNLWNVEIECDGAVAEAVDMDKCEASSFTSESSFELINL